MFKFTCPDCGSNVLLAVEHDVTVVSEVIGLSPCTDSLELGDIIETGDGRLVYVFCHCGWQLPVESLEDAAKKLKEGGFYADDSAV